MRTRLLLLVFAVAAFLVLAACGRGRHENGNDLSGCAYNKNESAESTNVKTLSVTAPQHVMMGTMLMEAGANMRRQMAQEGIDFILDVTVYDHNALEMHNMRFQTMMMAGIGYDIFMFDGQPLWSFANSGFLADIYELIDQDTSVSREDFYTHVLEAFEYNGRLISFPLSFGHRYIGVNSSLPQSFIDRFKSYSHISMNEIFQIYIDLQQKYCADFGHLSLFPLSFIPQNELSFAMGNFIDINERQAILTDSAFISFLATLQQTHELGGFEFHGFWSQIPIASRSTLSGAAALHVFSTPIFTLDPALALFDFEDPYFLHFIPISGMCGGFELIQNRFDPWGSFSISASADGPLAWDFIMNLISVKVAHSTPQNQSHFHEPLGTLNTPIHRSYFEYHRESTFIHTLSRMQDVGHRFANMTELAAEDRAIAERQMLEDAMERSRRYNEMPVAISPFVPSSLYEDILDGLLLGLYTPEDAAQLLQNRVSLWLIE